MYCLYAEKGTEAADRGMVGRVLHEKNEERAKGRARRRRTVGDSGRWGNVLSAAEMGNKSQSSTRFRPSLSREREGNVRA